MFEAQRANFPRTLRESLEGILITHIAILGLQNCGDAPECLRLSHGASRSHCEWSVFGQRRANNRLCAYARVVQSVAVTWL